MITIDLSFDQLVAAIRNLNADEQEIIRLMLTDHQESEERNFLSEQEVVYESAPKNHWEDEAFVTEMNGD